MTKQELKQYRNILKAIDRLEEEILMWRTRITSTAQSLEHIPKPTAHKDRIGDAIAEMESIRELIEEKYTELFEKRQAIEIAIASLNTADALIITMKYVDGKKWEQIAIDLNYSVQYVWKKHRQILEELKTL